MNIHVDRLEKVALTFDSFAPVPRPREANGIGRETCGHAGRDARSAGPADIQAGSSAVMPSASEHGRPLLNPFGAGEPSQTTLLHRANGRCVGVENFDGKPLLKNAQ